MTRSILNLEKAWELNQQVAHRPRTEAEEERLRRKVLRLKARVSIHLRPQASKYRAAALGCLATAHRYLVTFREEKARFERIRADGACRPWAHALVARARKNGGEREYLRMLLFLARSYLASSRRFGELADKFRLP